MGGYGHSHGFGVVGDCDASPFPVRSDVADPAISGAYAAAECVAVGSDGPTHGAPSATPRSLLAFRIQRIPPMRFWWTEKGRTAKGRTVADEEIRTSHG